MQFDILYTSYLGDLWKLSHRKFGKNWFRMMQFSGNVENF